MKKLLSVFVFYSLSLFGFCQDQPDIGSYMVYHSLVNPAANGSFDDFSAIIYGRKQWFSVPGSPALYGLQAAKPFKNISLGASLAQESIGVHSKQSFFITYTHRIKFQNDNFLAFGLSPGLIMLNSNYSRIETTDLQDNEFAGSKSIIRPDANFGIYYFSRKYFAGLSVPSLIKSTIVVSDGELSGISTFAPSYWHYYVLGGYNFYFNDFYSLSLSALVKKTEGVPANTDINVQICSDNFGAGISYRTTKELLLFGNINISSSVKLGYCYHNYFNIKNQYLAAHEIFITYAYLRSKQATIQLPRF